jgi:glycosyltransferase involved in cell wall biosynthesis
MDPTVSVIIPYYNRADVIGRAIGSVQRQSFTDWELIVVDDGSDDPVELRDTVSDDPRIRFLRHARNQGVSAARNTGVQAAQGRFVAFLDSDDEWLPKKLEFQLKAVCGTPAPDQVICTTRYIIFVSKRSYCIRPSRGPAPGRSLAEYLYTDGGFAQSSSFFLSSVLARSVPFCEALTTFEDHMFFIELGARGTEYLLVPDPLTVWHNEPRPDRITLGRDLAKLETNLRTFTHMAENNVSPHVLTAIEARCLSGLLWEHAPWASLRLLLRARRRQALSTIQIAALLCRNALPPVFYDLMRPLWDRTFRHLSN